MAGPPRTRSVARRIHTLVLLVAALPLVLLAIVTYSVVLETLETKALREAHQLARSAGLATLDRLRTASNGVALLYGLSADSGSTTAIADAVATEPTVQAWVPLAPERLASPKRFVSSSEHRQLVDQIAGARSDVPGLFLLDSDPVRVFLAPAKGPNRAPEWIAELDTDYLWDTESFDGVPEQICVLRNRQQVVFCNHGATPPWTSQGESPVAAHGKPAAVSDADGGEWYAATWDFFLKVNFHAPKLTVAVAVPEDVALAPLRRFTHVFSGVSLISVLVALAIGSRLVRSNLRPLAALRNAIDGFASGRMEGRATIDTGDDFQVIGDAFNDMADRIDDQFQHLEAISELQTALQKAHSLDQALINTRPVLERLLGCEFALVAIEHWKACPEVLVARRQRHGAVQRFPATDVGISSELTGDSNGNRLSTGYYLQLFDEADDAMLKAEYLEVVSLGNEADLAAELVLLKPSPADLAAAQRSAGILAVAMEGLVLDEKLRYQATHDWLTGLPNRSFLRSAFSDLARQCDQTGKSIGALMLDINRFKQVNDSLGHGRGDEMLKMIASRLSAGLPDDCMICRFTGDVFVVLLPDSGRGSLAARMSETAASIVRLLDEPYQISMRSVRLEGSIGGAIYPAHAESFEKLLSLLDVTMREAKSSKGGGYLMFEASFRTLQRNRLDIEQALKRAVANEEFVLHFQPVMKASCSQVMSAEALIRWNRPGSGMLGPESFIDIAEASGLIGPIGEWAIGETCREIRRWIDAGLEFDTINVNVSSVQLRDEHFEQRVDHALAAAGIPADTLTLEVTETALVDHFDEASARLQRLREQGIRILIDDFGTGFASLKYLKMLPIDGIKIDRLFVQELPDSNIDQSIVAAVSSLAQRSQFKLVAEGVETPEQARFLIDQGVTWLQGYLVSKPIPAIDMRARLKPNDKDRLKMRQASALASSRAGTRFVGSAK